MTRTAHSILALTLLAAACIAHPKGGPVPLEGLADGSYEGKAVSFPNSAKVRVQVEGGRMAEVELLQHGASKVGRVCDEVIPTRMVEQQSTVVDAVTGATNSSNVIMEAARKALDKAAKAE